MKNILSKKSLQRISYRFPVLFLLLISLFAYSPARVIKLINFSPDSYIQAVYKRLHQRVHTVKPTDSTDIITRDTSVLWHFTCFLDKGKTKKPIGIDMDDRHYPYRQYDVTER